MQIIETVMQSARHNGWIDEVLKGRYECLVEIDEGIRPGEGKWMSTSVMIQVQLRREQLQNALVNSLRGPLRLRGRMSGR